MIAKVAGGAAQTAAQVKQQLALYARTNGAAFNAYVLKDEQSGQPVRMAPMHRAWHQLAERYPRLNLISHVEAAKALAIDTPIPTPQGWRQMGDLRLGDVWF